MIKHIVMFRLKDANGRTAGENAVIAKDEAEKLRGKIPSLKEYEVRLNSPEADGSNYHIALICLFEDSEGLSEYQNHPEHKKFGEFIYGLRTDNGRACIDFEI